MGKNSKKNKGVLKAKATEKPKLKKQPIVEDEVEDTNSSTSINEQIVVKKIKQLKSKPTEIVSKKKNKKPVVPKPESDSDSEVNMESVEEPQQEDSENEPDNESSDNNDEDDSDDDNESKENEENHKNDSEQPKIGNLDEDDDSDDDEEEDDEPVTKKLKKIPNSKKTEASKPSYNSTQSNEDEPTKSNRVFISNLSKMSTSETIQSFLESKGLNVTDLYVPRNGNSHKGFAFAEFKDIPEADKACALSGQEIDRSAVNISFAKPRKGAPSPKFNKEVLETNILFIKNLDPNATSDDLKEHFGNAQEVRVMTNSDGSCKGHAYVEFYSLEAAKEAKRKAGNFKVNGKDIMVDFAKPRSQMNSNRGSFGGRGDRNRSSYGGDRRGGYGGHGGGNRDRGRGNFRGRGGSFGGRGGFDNRPRGNKIQFNDDD